MSQNFEIPVRLEFRPQKMKWSVVTAEIVAWRTEFGSHQANALKLAGINLPPSNFVVLRTGRAGTIGPLGLAGGMLVTVPVGALPAPIAALCGKPSFNATMPDRAKAEQFVFLISESAWNPGGRLADVRSMRDEFFALDEDVLALVTFARKWGSWDGLAASPFDPDAIIQTPKNDLPCIFPHEVWAKQKEFKQELGGSPAEWLSRPEARVDTRQRERAPYFFAEPENCKRAIEMTITADHLRGARFGFCSRPDCKALFEFQTARARKYCSWECGHLMAVRNSRNRGNQRNARAQRRGK